MPEQFTEMRVFLVDQAFQILLRDMRYPSSPMSNGTTCRRLSAVVHIDCIITRTVQASKYKLSYGPIEDTNSS